MAKKKADSLSRTKAARKPMGAKASKVANRLAAAGEMTEDNKETGSSSPARRVGISNDLIGSTAGMVWTTLNSQGPQTIASLRKSVDAPDELVMSAIGWLAREGKLYFDMNGKHVTVALVG